MCTVGHAIIEGTRIGVHDVIGLLQNGESVDGIVTLSRDPRRHEEAFGSGDIPERDKRRTHCDRAPAGDVINLGGPCHALIGDAG